MQIPGIRRTAAMAEAIAGDFYNDRLDLSARGLAPGSTWSRMPDVECATRLRESGASDRIVRLFLTFVAATDRMRDAALLWNNGGELLQSHPELLEPAEASAIPISALRERLSQCGIRREPVSWPRFPRVAGDCSMWVRMLAAPGGSRIDEIDIIPVAVDVHVRRVTENLGVVDTGYMPDREAKRVIHDTWRAAVARTTIGGPPRIANTCAALDPALGFFGKHWCSHCERVRRRAPVGRACDHCLRFPKPGRNRSDGGLRSHLVDSSRRRAKHHGRALR